LLQGGRSIEYCCKNVFSSGKLSFKNVFQQGKQLLTMLLKEVFLENVPQRDKH
jgi:hypothetical protein